MHNSALPRNPSFSSGSLKLSSKSSQVLSVRPRSSAGNGGSFFQLSSSSGKRKQSVEYALEKPIISLMCLLEYTWFPCSRPCEVFYKCWFGSTHSWSLPARLRRRQGSFLLRCFQGRKRLGAAAWFQERENT